MRKEYDFSKAQKNPYYPYYVKLAEKGLLDRILKDAIKKTQGLHKPGTLAKVEPELKRPLTQLEAYLSNCGYCTAQLLSHLEKIELIGIFISDGTMSQKLKKNNITRNKVLVYNIENFIVTTRGLIDRLVILIDAILNLGNDSQFISYNLIKENSHVQKLKLDVHLKKLKKICEEYHYPRNQIIHQSQFVTDDIRRLEMYSLLSENQKINGIKDEKYRFKTRFGERRIRAEWTKKVQQFTEQIAPEIEKILGKMESTYEAYKKRYSV